MLDGIERVPFGCTRALKGFDGGVEEADDLVFGEDERIEASFRAVEVGFAPVLA